jgi:hypothetical protein
MNLEEMTPLEKANLLEKLIAKAELDLDYSMKVKNVEDFAITFSSMKQIIKNTRELFATGRINKLDYDVRQTTINKYHNVLDGYLKKFPEFQNEEEIENNLGR